MLQQNGVELYKNEGLELVLRPIPVNQKKGKKQPAKSIIDNFGGVDENTKIPMPDSFDQLSDEQKLFYSSDPGNGITGTEPSGGSGQTN